MTAVDRLARFKQEYDIRKRKEELYKMGEGLFSLPQTEYPMLGVTNKELKLQQTLFGLYVDVIHTIDEWKTIEWAHVMENIEDMTARVDGFALRCKKMPARLRDWDAFKELKNTIEDFQEVLPLLQELSKPSIQPRHWEEVMHITSTVSRLQVQSYTHINLLTCACHFPHLSTIHSHTPHCMWVGIAYH
jgi:dynein heavy chain